MHTPKLTHNLRNISRMIVTVLLVGLFAFFTSFEKSGHSVQGATDAKDAEVILEIERTLKAIENRPDYAGAWMRLSVLYEEINEFELAKKSLETASKLNPDL